MKPKHIKYVGEDKPLTQRESWLDRLSPRQAYGVKHMLPPELEGQIDYDPRLDEDLEKEEYVQT